MQHKDCLETETIAEKFSQSELHGFPLHINNENKKTKEISDMTI